MSLIYLFCLHKNFQDINPEMLLIYFIVDILMTFYLLITK